MSNTAQQILVKLADDNQKCPYCNSSELESIEQHRHDHEETVLFLTIQCASCKELWEEIFELVSYRVKDTDGEYVYSYQVLTPTYKRGL